MDEVLGQVLRSAVFERLDRLSDLAHGVESDALLTVARSELPRLAIAWRAMLRAHEPDERGDCPTCSTRWHRCKAPCSVWRAAYEHLVAGGLSPAPEQTRRAGRHALRPAVAPIAGVGTG